jgi:diacylglycerol kinase family enzyme
VDFEGNPRWRYFTVAAGIGVDAHLFYKLSPALKSNAGMTAYYVQAWKLWMTHKMEHFAAECMETGNGGSRHAVLTELLAVRIRNFGNVLRELAPGASLHRNDLRLILCRTDSRSRYLLYVLRGLLGQNWNVGGIDLVHSDRVSCRTLPLPESTRKEDRKVYVEADGELLGTLPVEITVVPNAFALLVPTRK